jgi:hypothetical protein
LILKDIVDAINILNKKVDVVLEAVGPMQENMKASLANCAYDKDLISYLLQAASKDLANLESQAFAQYIEGMSALAARRGHKESQQFLQAMKNLEKKVPDSFLSNIQAKNAEIMKWQEEVEKKMKTTQELHVAMKRQIDEFKGMAAEYGAKVKGAAKSASMAAQKTQMEVRDAVNNTLNSAVSQVNSAVDSTRSKVDTTLEASKKRVDSEISRARSDIDKSLQAMDDKKKELEELARQAGINIIEAEKEISRINNSKPRKGRGRRN